jgi:predicted alpha/beta hydrolase
MMVFMKRDLNLAEPRDLRLTAADGTRLAATHHTPAEPDVPGSKPSESPWIVVGSATAVPRGFYRRFAEYAASRGAHVLTLDYRGIGGSAPKKLRGYAPDYLDWARQDLAAAVAYAAARGPVYLVGHSYAMHAIGLLPNHHQLRAAYVCAGGAGWDGYMPKSEQVRVWLLWNLIGPVCTRLFGYQPMKAMGIGENLPVSIYRQWKQWCRYPHYFFDDPTMRGRLDGFAQVRTPIAAANATDDWWALPTSRDAFVKGYSGTTVERVTLTPQELGVNAIGHMGYYRAAVGATLWPRIFDWLARQGMVVAEPPAR